MRFVEAPYLGQNSPYNALGNALEKTLKETEEKLKASEKENERLSLRIASLMEERHEEVGKMMEFNYRLLNRLDSLRDDHENLKKTVAASNEKFENKLAHYKSKASAQEKKINNINESALSLTNELYETSTITTATVKELQEDVEVLARWRNEVKVAEYELQAKQTEHELQATKVGRELQAKQVEHNFSAKQTEREFWGEVYFSPRSQHGEAACEEGRGISTRGQRGAWGDSARSQHGEAAWEEGRGISTHGQRGEAHGWWGSAISTRDRRDEGVGE
ncbi:hypothetical protein ACHAP8_001568 [Fusarium lateritium]